MAHSPHRQRKGCPLCKSHKNRRNGRAGLRPEGWWAFKGDLDAYAPLLIAAMVPVSLVGYSSAMEASER